MVGIIVKCNQPAQGTYHFSKLILNCLRWKTIVTAYGEKWTQDN